MNEMNDLEQLRTRYLAIVAELRHQWWECHRYGRGNSDLAHIIWRMRSLLEHYAQSIQLACDRRGLVWLQDECNMHICCAQDELASDEGDRSRRWIWTCRQEVAYARLTRRIATRVSRSVDEKHDPVSVVHRNQ